MESLEPQVLPGNVSSEQIRTPPRTYSQPGKLRNARYLVCILLQSEASTVEAVLKTIPENDQKIIETVSKLGTEIKNSLHNVDALSKRDTFKAATTRLRKSSINLRSKLEEDIAEMMQHASPTARLIILSMLQEAVDLYDISIKQMKASPEWSPYEKISLF